MVACQHALYSRCSLADWSLEVKKRFTAICFDKTQYTFVYNNTTTKKQKILLNYTVLEIKLSTGLTSQRRCIFEQVIFFTIFGLVVTLTFQLLTSKSNQFIFVPDYT